MRRNKTKEQQSKYYEVADIFEYMTDVYLNGNITAFVGLYKELNRDNRKDFIEHLFSALNIEKVKKIIIAII